MSDGCSVLTLAARTNCSVSITFSPTASGARSATFILTDNAAGSPQTVPITGTGTGQNPPLAIDSRFLSQKRQVLPTRGCAAELRELGQSR